MQVYLFLLIFSFALKVCGQSRPPFFAYVNGGVSDEENSQRHENDILSFYNGLFRKQAAILNANGVSSKFVPYDEYGNFLRKSDSTVAQSISSFGDQVKPANRGTVKALYEKIAKSAPSQAVIVYGDHGSSAGLALWNKEFLNPKEHFDLQKKIPSETVVQTINLQCYAGTMLVDQSRKLPSDIKDLPYFIDQYYPKNRCGLALSRHDETGQYNSGLGDWTNSPWTKYFQKKPHPSLGDLKWHLREQEEIAPNILTTSDYMVDDITNAICNPEIQRRSDSEKCKDGPNNLNAITSFEKRLLPALCDDRDTREKIESLGQKINDETLSVSPTFRSFILFHAKEFLSKEGSSLAKNINAMNYLEYLKYKKSTATSKEEVASLDVKISKVGIPGDFSSKYAHAIGQLISGQNKEFNIYLQENCNYKWLKEFDAPAKLVPSGSFFANIKNYPPKFDCKKTVEDSNRKSRKLQIERKSLIQEQAAKRESIIKLHMAKPEMIKVKERYENIKRCENQILNPNS